MNDLTSIAMQELDITNKTQQLNAMAEQAPKKIGEPEVRKAIEILKKYKAGKAHLEAKLIADEEYWKGRQWKYINSDGAKAADDFQPATPWLFSCIQSRHADVMDSYPTCNIVPRQQDDKQEAKILSEIIPVILNQNDYEETYSDIARYMLIHGGCIQGVFWDSTKHNGLGDIEIRKIDWLNFFAEPGCTDIQKSSRVFTTELVDNDKLIAMYPQCEGKLGAKPITLAHYIYDDHVDTSEKSIVVDMYYKKVVNGRETLQYMKFVNDILLYATENDTTVPTDTQVDPATNIPVETPVGESMAMRGLYDHAKYPFVVQSLYKIEGSLCGYGLTDVGRDSQTQIDLINRAITENVIAGSKPRYFFNRAGAVNEDEFKDINQAIVHVEGGIDENHVRVIDYKPLSNIYLNFLTQKADELKYATANVDANNGVAPGGVTSASGIAALQETAGKQARNANKAFHRAYKEVIYFVIELIRQFYDTPRTFRIATDAMSGGEQYVDYSNAGIKPQMQMNMGINMGYRVPEFDIDVTTEKANPYKKMEINDLALQFYGNGFFNPQMADQALATLQMMDFDQKDEIMQVISQNGTLYQQLLQYQQIALKLASAVDPGLADGLANQIMAGGQPMLDGLNNVSLPADNQNEHPYVEAARERARTSTVAD